MFVHDILIEETLRASITANNMKIAIFMLVHDGGDHYICGGGGDIRSTPLNSLSSTRRYQFKLSLVSFKLQLQTMLKLHNLHNKNVIS